MRFFSKKTKVQDVYSTFNIVKRVFKEYVIPNKFRFMVAMILISITSSAVAYRAYLVKPAIDKIFVNKESVQLIIVAMQLFAVGLVLCFTHYFSSLILQKTNLKISTDLQKRLFNSIICKDIDYFKNRSSGKIISYFNDINGLMEIINIILSNLILQVVTLISLVGLMLYQNFRLTLMSGLGFVIVIKPLMSIARRIKRSARKNKEKGTILYASVCESVENIEVVKSNGTEEFEKQKTKDVVDSIYEINLNMIKQSILTTPIMEFVSSFGFCFVLLYGGYLVINNHVTTGEFFTFFTAMMSAYKPAKSFSGLNIKMQNAIVSAKRIYQIIDDKPRILEIENSVVLDNVKGEIEFKNVSYQYKVQQDTNFNVIDTNNELINTKAVDNLSLKMQHGKSYALVGHSGSGKSTIFNLLLRFYDPTEGDIYVDNVNLKNLSFKTLRKNISLVSQNIKLFDTTIFENIKYAKQDTTYEEVIKAAKMANVDEFVITMENGYGSRIGPNGTLLSGGQKQRISIARALLKNSPILLLDEATSALDPISEKLIQEALNKLMVDKTTIIIAHRLSTIVNCDCIFVFEKGKLMEYGDHKTLIDNNFIYKNLCDKQFGGRVKLKND